MYYEAIKIKTIEYDHLVHIYCISCDDIPRYTGQARSIFSKRRKYAKGEGFSNDIIKNFYLNAKKVRMEEVASVVVKDKEGQIQANKLEHDFIIKLETSTEFGGANINYGGAPLKAPEWEKAYLETPDYRVLIEKKDEPGIIFDYDPRQASKEFDISLPDLKRLSTEYAQVYNQVY